MAYKTLGFVVWQGARWYARRRVNRMLPSRRVTAAALVAGTLGVAALVAARADRD
ncbi:MAG TPA: hypothetical protein VGF63_11835 [Solirubrobacteraceae bacterium]|jgi:hypothetical protein